MMMPSMVNKDRSLLDRIADKEPWIVSPINMERYLDPVVGR